MHDVLVPVDLLFAYRACEDLPQATNSGEAQEDTVAVPLTALPLAHLVAHALKGNGALLDEECLASTLACLSEEETLSTIEFRRRIRLLRWNPFPHRPTISTMENDCLMVQDGIELCCVAKVLGKSWIRVAMSEEVRARWLERTTKELDDVVKRTSRRAFYSPIAHPAYRNAKVSRPDSTRLDRIRLLLGPLGPELTGLDIGCNMGYMCHHLRRQGFRMTGIDYDENHLAVARALNETYGLDVEFESCYFSQFKTDTQFDITLALTVLYHMFFRQEEQSIPQEARIDRTALLRKIDALTRHALLWESGPDPKHEIDLVCSNSGLTDYCPLGVTKGTGKRREMGVFLRPHTELSDYLKKRHTKYFSK